MAIYDIVKVPGGSKLTFTQIGIPPNRYSGHYRGWIETILDANEGDIWGRKDKPAD